MPMKCPFCGEEMTPGVIQSRDSGSSVFGGAAAEAFNCPRCKKIILDYSVRHLPL